MLPPVEHPFENSITPELDASARGAGTERLPPDVAPTQPLELAGRSRIVGDMNPSVRRYGLVDHQNRVPDGASGRPRPVYDVLCVPPEWSI